MLRSLEAILRHLDDEYPAFVTAEDLDGRHRDAFRLFLRMGFLADEPGMNPVPTCPFCVEGTPYRLEDRYLCNHCHSEVDVRHLHLWPLDLEAFLGWLARSQRLQGDLERVTVSLWRLGTLESAPGIAECFYLRGRMDSEVIRRRLAVYRSVLLLHGKAEEPLEGPGLRCLSLAEVLKMEGTVLTARPLASFFHRGGRVRFEAETGSLRAGDLLLGTVPTGTRESAFIECLAASEGSIVAYSDLKHAVCKASGSRDETEEATFCHKLKSRLKRHYGITAIDRLILSDARGRGYLMRTELVKEEG